MGDFPKNFIVSGGEAVGDVDVGYGPARVFTAAETAEIAAALSKITYAELRSRFDAAAFSEEQVYLDIWDEPIEECVDSYPTPSFEKLKEFIEKATSEGRGLVVYLN